MELVPNQDARYRHLTDEMIDKIVANNPPPKWSEQRAPEDTLGLRIVGTCSCCGQAYAQSGPCEN